MDCYYVKRGDLGQRERTDEATLTRMAEEGRLAHDDLVWIEGKTNGWVRARAVPGLLPAPPEPDMASQPKLTGGGEPEVVRSAEPQPFAVRARWVVAAIVVLVIAVLAVHQAARQALRHAQAARTPEPLAEMPPTTNAVATTHAPDWAPQLEQLSTLIMDGALSQARLTVHDIREAGCTNARLQRLDEDLTTAESNAAFVVTAVAALRSGELDIAQAPALVRIAHQLAKPPALDRELSQILASERPSPEGLVQAMAVALAMGNTNLASKAMSKLTATLPPNVPFETCRQAMGLAAAHGLDEECVVLARAFLDHNPENAAAWLELAAFECIRNREDEALDALKQMSRNGTDELRMKAATDPRFESLRDNRRFQRYVR